MRADGVIRVVKTVSAVVSRRRALPHATSGLVHRLLPLVEPPGEREPRRVALDLRRFARRGDRGGRGKKRARETNGQDLVRHGHRVVHHEPPSERRHVARLVLALDRRVGVERRPQLLEPLEPLRERRVEEERLEHEVRVHVERRRRVERPRHDGVADAQRAVALLVVEPRRQEHGPFHGVGRGGPEPADLQVAVGRGAHLRAGARRWRHRCVGAIARHRAIARS